MTVEVEYDRDPSLLQPPIRRAAYSDRTAWLMALMARFAYIRFEAPPSHAELKEIAKSIADEPDIENIVKQLSQLANSGEGEQGMTKLKTELGSIGFSLIETFDVGEGLYADTQAYIAHVEFTREDDSKDDMLVLAFRGTEPTKLADIRADLDAEMVSIDGVEDDQAKVHNGFYRAFKAVEEKVDEVIKRYPECPLYITGHSLGGALALMATRFVANKSLGACYTFGSPRACNSIFARQIYTPVYRVVNASDAVPTVPPASEFMYGAYWLVKRIPFLRFLAPTLKTMRDYRHHGDQKYLTIPKAKLSAYDSEKYDLILKSHRNFIDWYRGIRRNWKAPIGDHSIDLYVQKLFHYAMYRQRLKRRLNPTLPDEDLK